MSFERSHLLFIIFAFFFANFWRIEKYLKPVFFAVTIRSHISYNIILKSSEHYIARTSYFHKSLFADILSIYDKYKKKN